MADAKLIATLSSLLGSLPGVKEKQFPNHTSFFTGKSIFVFTSRTSNRVILKLPKERIATLLQRDDITLLTMGKRTMKEWIVIEHTKPADYKKTSPSSRKPKPSSKQKRKEKTRTYLLNRQQGFFQRHNFRIARDTPNITSHKPTSRYLSPPMCDSANRALNELQTLSTSVKCGTCRLVELRYATMPILSSRRAS
jgi:hypothetical protein